MTGHELLADVDFARGTGHDRLVPQMPLDIHGQAVGGLVTAVPVLLQALHHDPVEVPFDLGNPLLDRQAPGRGGGVRQRASRVGFRSSARLAQPRARCRRILLPDHPPHPVPSRGEQILVAKGREPGQEFVQQHPQAVDVRTRVDVQPGQFRLLRTHIGWRSDELVQLRMDRFAGQAAFSRLGDAEVDHFGHGHTVLDDHQDVRGLEIPVNHPLLVRVLDRPTDTDNQAEPLRNPQALLVAILGDPCARDQLHDKVRAVGVRRAGVQDLGDVRMVH